MNKSKEEILEEVKQYMTKPLVGLDGVELMLLSHHVNKRWMACTILEKDYKEYQMRKRLIKQVTKK